MKKGAHWAGWSDFRYGNSKPISLAGKKTQPVMTAGKRKHVVSQVLDLMRDWRSSPFENEGPCRHGLRQSFVLKGNGWSAADYEAALIVSTCLSRLGADRPTWEQGQREYSTARENCSWCGGEVPIELLASPHATRFCSDVCARSSIEQRDFEARRHESAMFRAAWDVINRSRNEVRTCMQCAQKFRPVHGTNKGVYCSASCRDAGRTRVPDRNCKQCGILFVPHKRDSLFCSHTCYWQHGNPVEYKKICIWCSRTFFTKSGKAIFCKQSCAVMMSHMRTGRRIPRTLSPPVFDYYIAVAA